MKILAVEDNAVARTVLREALKRLGHEATEAPDGEAAWDLLQQQSFRVVVSDWMMPRSDGLDLCRQIRSQIGSDYTYFILLTSRDATKENQTEAARFAGVVDTIAGGGADSALHHPGPATRGDAPDLLLLQKDPRRQKLLAVDRGLHRRPHGQRFQPFDLPGLLQAGRVA